MHFTNHNVSDLFISWQGKDLILQSLDNADSKVIIEQQDKILHRIENKAYLCEASIFYLRSK